MDWLEIAKELPHGSKTRYAHDCSTHTDAIINTSNDGYSLHCFKCGEHVFVYRGQSTLAELDRVSKLNEQAKETLLLVLPKDFTPTIPTQYAIWLYKAGISRDVARSCNIGWSPSLHRIVIPIYNPDGKLVYWQARAVLKGQRPKYINPPADKSSLLYTRIPLSNPSRRRIVITEDILSCIRVGKHIPCASILGTGVSDGQCLRLGSFRRVSVWLDPDSAGQRGTLKCCRKLRLHTEADSIHSKVDPKCLSDREIRKLLCLPPNNEYTYHGHIITQDP